MQQETLRTADHTYIQALAIRQQVNLMTAGRTHADPLPLDLYYLTIDTQTNKKKVVSLIYNPGYF
jgi:hypothetical protein